MFEMGKSYGKMSKERIQADLIEVYRMLVRTNLTAAQESVKSRSTHSLKHR